MRHQRIGKWTAFAKHRGGGLRADFGREHKSAAGRSAARSVLGEGRCLLGLSQVVNCLLLRWEDTEKIHEGSNLEQAPDLSTHLTEGKLTLPFLNASANEEQAAKACATDIGKFRRDKLISATGTNQYLVANMVG
jgi:hypothetical protein